jgi:transposase
MWRLPPAERPVRSRSGACRWRALDLGVIPTYIEAEVPRVRCKDDGVVVCSGPWARHGAGHTRAFDDTAAWLATRTSKTARFALWKNPEDLTERQQTKLATIQRTNERLYRAYLLKEQLRQVFHLRGKRGMSSSISGSPGHGAAASPPSSSSSPAPA